jgi:hypothetical protein
MHTAVHRFLAGCLAAVAGFINLSSALAQDIDATTGLTVAPGWELVRIHCGGCHSHKVVTSQRADRKTWQDTIRWMQATQNLWQFDRETEHGILDYLAANYPPQANRRRAPIPPTLMPPADPEVR